MPSREVHRLISRVITGYDCDKTHATIDLPYRYFPAKYKRKHRILFHDPLSAVVIGYLCDGEMGAVSGVAHIMTDYLVSRLRKKV